MRNNMPDSLEDRPITLTAWLLGVAVIAFIVALMA